MLNFYNFKNDIIHMCGMDYNSVITWSPRDLGLLIFIVKGWKTLCNQHMLETMKQVGAKLCQVQPLLGNCTHSNISATSCWVELLITLLPSITSWIPLAKWTFYGPEKSSLLYLTICLTTFRVISSICSPFIIAFTRDVVMQLQNVKNCHIHLQYSVSHSEEFGSQSTEP